MLLFNYAVLVIRLEVKMQKFYISIKKNEKIFGNLDKIEIQLNTSHDIVDQAEKITSTTLDSFDVPQDSREGFSWKVYKEDFNKFMMVSQSSNWRE